MSRIVAAFVLVFSCVAGVALAAADYCGTYRLDGPQGAVLLTLECGEPGAIRGSLKEGTTTFRLEEGREEPAIRGHAIADTGERMGFRARMQKNGELHLELFPYDPQGQPIYKVSQTLVFQPFGEGVAAASADDVAAPQGKRAVYINRVRLEDDFVRAMEQQYGVPVEDGRYWYDAACGAWGVEGGPTAGMLMAGLALPGPMPEDISGGGTGIFINGREVHVLDKAGLEQLFGYSIPGRYWLDAAGNCGPEGGPATLNLFAAIQQAQAAQSGSVTHGYDSTYGARGTLAGGMYSGRTASGKSVFWYPGM